MSSTEALYLVLLIMCFVLSGFFSGSETAFTSFQRVRLEHLVENRVRGARRVARMLQKPEKFLSTVLLGNTFVNILAASLATALAIDRWGQQGVLIATIVITVLLLIFAETTPKTIAAHHAERIALLAVRPLEVLAWVFTPFVFVLSWIASRAGWLLGSESVPHSLATSDEIRNMISVGQREGSVEEHEAKMLDKVFDFGDRPVYEVMVPRPEVIALEKGSSAADFLALYAASPVSRFPVYQENMDNVVGILSVKDVLMSLAKNPASRDDTIDDLIRPAYFTPEIKLISELFTEMRDNNFRMAVLIDEYGGTAGIVSISRLVEEIVGPVGDEMGAAEKEFEVINANTFQIDGSMRIEEANQEMGLDLPESEEYETIAGFILSLLGNIPRQGRQLKYNNVKIVVTRMKGMKIEEVLVTREKPSTPSVEGEKKAE